MFQNLGGSALQQSNFFGGEKATPTEPLDFAAFWCKPKCSANFLFYRQVGTITKKRINKIFMRHLRNPFHVIGVVAATELNQYIPGTAIPCVTECTSYHGLDFL